jgi:hypothetical protein
MVNAQISPVVCQRARRNGKLKWIFVDALGKPPPLKQGHVKIAIADAVAMAMGAPKTSEAQIVANDLFVDPDANPSLNCLAAAEISVRPIELDLDITPVHGAKSS